MMDGQARLYALQAARVACIPREADLDLIHAQADALAREWEREAAYLGCALLMRIRGSAADVHSAWCYRSEARGQTRVIELPCPINAGPGRPQRDGPLSGRITDVSAWHDSWVAVIESCVTEIGLSLETRLWIEVDAKNDTLRFRVDADGPARSWQRNLHVVSGVLTDSEHGEIWDFKTDPAGG
jgi:hypothetical protein